VVQRDEGLEPARAVELGSSEPFRLIDPASGRDVWKPSYTGALRVVADGAAKIGNTSVTWDAAGKPVVTFPIPGVQGATGTEVLSVDKMPWEFHADLLDRIMAVVRSAR